MNRPEMLELECLLAVGEELNFSRAARRLSLTQPPLTRHIQSLERKLGVKLFTRSTRAVALTPAGERYLADVRGLLAQLDRAGETARRAGAGETEVLRLGFIGALMEPALVKVIRDFRRGRPGCQVHVTDLPPASQWRALQAGELDGAFLGALPERLARGYEAVVWKEEPLWLALPEGDELGTMRRLQWSDLREQTWVMVSREAAPAFRAQFSRWSEEHALRPRLAHESERVSAILTMVAAGNGLSVVPESLRGLMPEGITYRELPRPTPKLRHAFVYRQKGLSPAMGEFLRRMKHRA